MAASNVGPVSVTHLNVVKKLDTILIFLDFSAHIVRLEEVNASSQIKIDKTVLTQFLCLI